MTTIHPNFHAWATSLAGCDGGDLNAQVWLCGLEWGYGHKRRATSAERTTAMRRYYDDVLLPEIACGAYQPSDTYDWEEHTAYPYGRWVAKILMAMHNQPIERYAEISSAIPDPRMFKLNLYPIPFEYTDDWLWEHYEMPQRVGLPTKHAYRAWCALHRFPALARHVCEHNPRLIIGTGTTYLTEFLLAFAGERATQDIHLEALGEPRQNGTTRSLYWARINGGRTVIAVIPFLGGRGRYAINSNILGEEVGKRLALIAPPGQLAN